MTQQGHAVPDDVESRIERLRLRTQRLTQQRNAQAQSENPRSPEPPAESDEDIDFDCDYTASAGISAPTPPPFNVTTTSEEEEESSTDDYPNVETMADRIQREGRWRPSSDDENEDVAPVETQVRDFVSCFKVHSSQMTMRCEHDEFHLVLDIETSLTTPNLFALVDFPDQARSMLAPSILIDGMSLHRTRDSSSRRTKARSQSSFSLPCKSSRHGLSAFTHASRSSGRNILLKLWSPKDSDDGNIDIESVQFYGYSGPRFFQATTTC